MHWKILPIRSIARWPAVCLDVTDAVWKLLVAPGQLVKSGATLIAIESMKMEVALTVPAEV